MIGKLRKRASAIWCIRFKDSDSKKQDSWKVSSKELWTRFYLLLVLAVATAVVGTIVVILTRRVDVLAPVAASGLSELPVAVLSGSLGLFLYKGSLVTHKLGHMTNSKQADGFLTGLFAITFTFLSMLLFLLLLTGSSYLLAIIDKIPKERFFSFLGAGITIDVQQWMSTAVVLIGLMVGLSAHVLYPSCWSVRVREESKKGKQKPADAKSDETNKVNTGFMVKVTLKEILARLKKCSDSLVTQVRQRFVAQTNANSAT